MKYTKYSVFTMILALLLALSLVGCDTVAENVSETVSSDVTTENHAPVCTEHRWIDASCTHSKLCLACGETEGEPVPDAHAYTEKDGAYVCVYCGVAAPETPCEHVKGADTCPLCGREALNVIKNVIYIIGDGMGLEHIAAGEMAYGKDYVFDDWSFVSSNTDSLTPGGRNQSELTDSAAGATALATGVVTLNGYVGVDQDGNELSTVLDFAKERGKRTGVITTDYLYGATPGGFSAHCNDRDESMAILESQIQSNIDLLCGAVKKSVALDEEIITENGYRHCSSLPAMKASMSVPKLYCTLDLEGYSSSANPVKLCDVTASALKYLDNDEGFVLMIEQAHIDKASHNNEFEKMVRAVNSLNETVDAILEWIGDRTDTVVLITADHETGDFSASSSKTLPYSASVDGGPTVYYRFNSGSHTKSNVPLFIYGADVDIESISYFGTPYTVKNSDIYKIVCKLIQNQR